MISRPSFSRFFVFSLFISALFFLSCSKKNDKIVFEATDPLELSPQTQWILIVSPYAPIYKEPDFQSIVVTHARKGEILKVEGMKTTKIEDQKIKWIAVSNGWVVTSELEIFSNKLRAENALRKLLGDLAS